MAADFKRLDFGRTLPPFKLSRATAQKHEKLHTAIEHFNSQWHVPETREESEQSLIEELAILETVEGVLVAIEKEYPKALAAATKAVETIETKLRAKLLDLTFDTDTVDQVIDLHPAVIEARSRHSQVSTFSFSGTRQKAHGLIERRRWELDSQRRRPSLDEPTGRVNRSRPLFPKR